jgi:hypothetical protein
MLSKAPELVVNQPDFNRQAGILRILAIFVEQQVPFGLQLLSKCVLVDCRFWHAGEVLPIIIVRFLLPENSVVTYMPDEPILSGTGKGVPQRKACDMVVVRSRSVAGPGGVEASLGPPANYLPVEAVSVQNCTVPRLSRSW